MPSTVVEAERLERRFASVSALGGVDLRVSGGEAVAIVGPNGAGKSTLLRLLATSLRPSAGRLSLFGKSVADATVSLRSRIGVLSHHSFLYPDLTPTENLEFYARMFRLRDAGQRVGELLESVGLIGWANRPVRTLSRGLEQRCALARTILHRPDLILLDEPFTGLDIDAANMLTTTLRSENARGATVLMVTHDLTRALDICRRALVLVGGVACDDINVTGWQLDAFDSRYRRLIDASRSPAGGRQGT